MEHESPKNQIPSSPTSKTLPSFQKESKQFISEPLVDLNCQNEQPKSFKINFYSSYLSFQNKISLKPSINTAQIKEQAQMLEVNNQLPSQVESKIMINDSQVNSQAQAIKWSSRKKITSPRGVCQMQEGGIINGSKKIYEFNRAVKSWKGDGKRSMVRKITRGIWSISSRKYQPNEDLYQIFDEEELANTDSGLDQCRLWCNLMNKYINLKKRQKKSQSKKKIKIDESYPEEKTKLLQEEKGIPFRIKRKITKPKPLNHRKEIPVKREEDEDEEEDMNDENIVLNMLPPKVPTSNNSQERIEAKQEQPQALCKLKQTDAPQNIS